MDDIFGQMLARYPLTTRDDERNAKHEVMQQIALAGLYRGNFFDKAAFYGGTCLRIFHGLERFSEDMDFSLLAPEYGFLIEKYFDAIKDEFNALGREVEIRKKKKTTKSNIESAFLKDNTDIYNIRFQTEPSIKIKLEIDTDPPKGFQTESKLLMAPFSFMTRCYSLPSLFAGKMHAFLFRGWSNRVKGRDWYDLEWYVRNNVLLNLDHFLERGRQSGKIEKEDLSGKEFIELVQRRIEKTNIEMVKADVAPFIKNRQSMETWSTEYFFQLAEKIRVE